MVGLALTASLLPTAGALTTEARTTDGLRNGCHRTFTRDAYRGYARRIYRTRDSPLRDDQKARIKLMRKCMGTRKRSRWAWQKKAEWRRAFRQRLATQRLTPYGPCYGGRWAVPCEIIGGESGGYWGAQNSNGCVGPYQFCGWSVPWPVDSEADKIAHHRMAARLWNGGAGCSNWTQTSSAC